MKKRKIWSLVLGILLVAVLLSACELTDILSDLLPIQSGQTNYDHDDDQEEDEPEHYTVTFHLNGGELVSGELVQTVKEGRSASAPQAVNGKKTLSWDKDFSNVTSDMTVNAVWTQNAMTPQELLAYGQSATVTVNMTHVAGGQYAGSGFFIDENGTLITAFHVIEGAANITVMTQDGGTYDLEKVIAFNPVYDIAILKIDYKSHNYLEISDTPAVLGDSVYAIGSSLGSLNGSCSDGIISAEKRTVGKIECLQTDAAISSGNSGGPLINVYGEVVGINCFVYIDGQNLNLAVKVAMLDNIGEERNFTMSEMKEWYNIEASRSYSPYVEKDEYLYSLVNTYSTVTGATCLFCYDDDGRYQEGHHDMCIIYCYRYDKDQFDKYTQYLRDHGFVYEETELEDGDEVHYYDNEKDNYYMQLTVSQSDNRIYVTIISYG